MGKIHCSKCDCIVEPEEVFYVRDKTNKHKTLSLCIPCYHNF